MPDPVARIGPFEEAPYDPEPEREKIRGRVTLAATLVFGAVLMTDLLAAFLASDARWARVKDAMQVVLPAISTIVGTIIGFYFGAQKRS